MISGVKMNIGSEGSVSSIKLLKSTLGHFCFSFDLH